MSRRLAHCVQHGLARRKYHVWPLSAQRICVVGVSGLLFEAHLAAASLRRATSTWGNREIDLPELDVLRDNPTEFRAVNIARLLDNEENGTAVRAVANGDKLRHDHHARLFSGAANDTCGAGNERLPCALTRCRRCRHRCSVFVCTERNQLQRRICPSEGGIWMPGDESEESPAVAVP